MTRLALLALGLAMVQHAAAATVSVHIAASSGSTEGTLTIFDPIDAQPPPSRQAASIDQIDKQFVPKVSIIRTGTAVSFPNSDHIRHQVYSFSHAKAFNLKLYAGTHAAPVLFDKPGLVVLGCNIHDKMLAFVGVVDTPYFAKIDAGGNATLELPAGRYRLRVWNPNLSAPAPSQQINVQSAPQSVVLTVALNAGPAALAEWPE